SSVGAPRSPAPTSRWSRPASTGGPCTTSSSWRPSSVRSGASLPVAGLYPTSRFCQRAPPMQPLPPSHARSLLRLVPAAPCRAAACRPGGRGRDGAVCAIGEHRVGGIAEPAALEPVIPVRKKAWEAALGGERAARPSVRARLVGWPAPTPRVDGRALPADDTAFALQVARDTWRGLEGLTDRENDLPVDHVHVGPLAPDVAPVGDYTSVATVGLVMTALVGAAELGLVGRDAAVARLTALFDTLDRLETHAGLFFNYYDTTSL